MNERGIRGLIDGVKSGALSRRGFVKKMVAVGLTAPMATQMLMASGVAMAQSAPSYKPTKAGGGGPLKVLWWQGPTLLNPHFANGTKDQDGSRIFYEPLAGWDADGNLRPLLAAEIPSREDGSIAADGMSVVWKLKKNVKWHDGKPFTANDVVFTWAYVKDPATAATTIGSYKDVTVEKVDDYSVKVIFSKPTPFWANAFVGTNGMIIPKHLFADYAGGKSRDAPTNLKPVGTGAYVFKEFKPGNLVSGTRNPDYHQSNKPYFDSIEMKGGGDAVSAARAVLQTGEYDFAWNMQVEDEILLRLEKSGKGKVIVAEAGGMEHIEINFTDPNTEVDGERSSLKTKHPSLSDKAVRDALNLLIDRASVEKFIYGRTGIAAANMVNYPKKLASKLTYEFSIDKANALLDKAGWKKGADGIREKGGVKLKYVFQTSINQPRQKTQAIVKQACQKAGIDIEVKAVVASVYFSSDVANPDTFPHFYTDLQMYTNNMASPDSEVFMRQFLKDEIATKANKWQGKNTTRWQSQEYEDTFKAAQTELDPAKRVALLIKLNDLVIQDVAVIPVVARPTVVAMNSKLHAEVSGWDNNTFDLCNWYKDA